MSSVTCDSVVKEEFKVEHQDELILPREEGEHTDDISANTILTGQCLYDVMSDLSIQNQFAAPAKQEFVETTPTATQQNFEWAFSQQKYPSDCPSFIETGQSLPMSQLIKTSSLKHSISKRGAEWYGKHITPPKKFDGGWCDSRKAKAILDFLESFAGISRGSRYSRCANFSIACNGPRVLVCEECLSQFGGLHDRYLKICRHFKTSHSRNCNKLIGLKLSKHHSTFLLMIAAWQQDTYESLQ